MIAKVLVHDDKTFVGGNQHAYFWQHYFWQPQKPSDNQKWVLYLYQMLNAKADNLIIQDDGRIIRKYEQSFCW